jgi:predicted transcriptional regulator
MNRENIERNQKMIDFWNTNPHCRYADVGRAFGITRQAAKQIIDRILQKQKNEGAINEKSC